MSSELIAVGIFLAVIAIVFANLAAAAMYFGGDAGVASQFVLGVLSVLSLFCAVVLLAIGLVLRRRKR